jgi:hypothetical protein
MTWLRGACCKVLERDIEAGVMGSEKDWELFWIGWGRSRRLELVNSQLCTCVRVWNLSDAGRPAFPLFWIQIRITTNRCCLCKPKYGVRSVTILMLMCSWW